ncbi:hypothetical protein INR49_003614 [Caranx melampygus]|nr:hypothetical protein INR49_003614 [Caranx melampygus]
MINFNTKLILQAPVFFVASLHHCWEFGELTCELYTFCSALFGITSMMSLTHPLTHSSNWVGCYFAVFHVVWRAGQEMKQLGCGENNKAYERLHSERRMAKVVLGVILLFIMSWSPYSAVALTATAGYAHLLTSRTSILFSQHTSQTADSPSPAAPDGKSPDGASPDRAAVALLLPL